MNQNVSTKKSLSDYKRRETIFITLPSNSSIYPPGTINLSPSGELGIKPMTSADQITLSNPESLISGDASIKIFESCVSGVLYPDTLLAPDIEAIYAGIRLATYGENTELELRCPKCDHYHAFDMPIRYSLENMTFLPEDPKVTVEVPDGDGGTIVSKLDVYVRPYTLVESTQDANIKFQQSKAAQMLFKDDESLENDVMKSKFFESIQNIASETVKLMANCVIKIVDVEDGQEFDLEDKSMILDWVNNLPAKEADKITSLINKLNTDFGIKKNVDIECDNCSHKWSANINFDPTSFFG